MLITQYDKNRFFFSYEKIKEILKVDVKNKYPCLGVLPDQVVNVFYTIFYAIYRIYFILAFYNCFKLYNNF